MHTNTHGSLLVEAMLAGAVFGLLVMGLVGVLSYAQDSVRLAGARTRAAYLAEEGVEAVRNLRDAAYANLANGTYGLSTAGNHWSFSGSNDVTDIFTRSVTIGDVSTNVKSVTSTVTWQQNPQRRGTVTVVTHLTNWLAAKAAAIGNWALPLSLSGLDLVGADDGIKIQIGDGYAYVIRAAGSVDFAVIDIQNPTAPVAMGVLSLSGTPVNLVVSGDYAYVTSNDDNQEIKVINISNPFAPVLAGGYNMTGTIDASGIAINGSLLYVGRVAGAATNEFSVFKLSTPTSLILAGSLSLSGSVTEIALNGNYAYVATTDNGLELQVVNISTSILPLLAGTLNLSGSEDALTITNMGSTVIIGRSGGALSVINATNPAAPTQAGTISLGANINDLSLGNSGKYVFAGTSNATNEFRVVDITTLTAPSILGSRDAAGSIMGIAYDPETDRAYGVSQADGAEFMVFRPS